MKKFNKILSELTEALENFDTTLVNDFLEYELDPALGELIAAIPGICAQVENFKFEE